MLKLNFDPVASDPVAVDAAYPAANVVPPLVSAGDSLLGVLLLAQGAGPHPTILLLHGFPGYERNFDLGQILRRAGYNVLIFHYRGAWGSPGIFRFRHVLEDAAAALEFLRSDQARKDYRVDKGNIIVVGHSMGGFAALMTAANDGQVQRVVSLAGWQIGVEAAMLAENPDEVPPVFASNAVNLRPLQVESEQALLDEALAHIDEWTITNHAQALAGRSLLLVAAKGDGEVPADKHHVPLVAALRAAGAQDLQDVTLDSDHSFAGKRVELAHVLLEWLEKQR